MQEDADRGAEALTDEIGGRLAPKALSALGQNTWEATAAAPAVAAAYKPPRAARR